MGACRCEWLGTYHEGFNQGLWSAPVPQPLLHAVTRHDRVQEAAVIARHETNEGLQQYKHLHAHEMCM